MHLDLNHLFSLIASSSIFVATGTLIWLMTQRYFVRQEISKMQKLQSEMALTLIKTDAIVDLFSTRGEKIAEEMSDDPNKLKAMAIFLENFDRQANDLIGSLEKNIDLALVVRDPEVKAQARSYADKIAEIKESKREGQSLLATILQLLKQIES